MKGILGLLKMKSRGGKASEDATDSVLFSTAFAGQGVVAVHGVVGGVGLRGVGHGGIEHTQSDAASRQRVQAPGRGRLKMGVQAPHPSPP